MSKLFSLRVHIFDCNNAYVCGYEHFYLNISAYMFMDMSIGSKYVSTWMCVDNSINRIAKQVKEVSRLGGM